MPDIEVPVVDFSVAPEGGNFNKSMLSFRTTMMINRQLNDSATIYSCRQVNVQQ
jgi:hypothetical protein